MKILQNFVAFSEYMNFTFDSFLAGLGRNQVYSVIHNSIAPSKELSSKMALGEVGV